MFRSAVVQKKSTIFMSCPQSRHGLRHLADEVPPEHCSRGRMDFSSRTGAGRRSHSGLGSPSTPIPLPFISERVMTSPVPPLPLRPSPVGYPRTQTLTFCLLSSTNSRGKRMKLSKYSTGHWQSRGFPRRPRRISSRGWKQTQQRENRQSMGRITVAT
jgi:hypothetical protein